MTHEKLKGHSWGRALALPVRVVNHPLPAKAGTHVSLDSVIAGRIISMADGLR